MIEEVKQGPRIAEMSIVLVTDRYQTIRGVMDRLRAQTARERLEIVIVCPYQHALEVRDGELDGFAGVKVVEIGSIRPLAAGLAAGVRAASAAVVQLGETHAYPDPDWAEVLLRAHSDGWGVVVPGMGNANPDGPLSWACLLIDYGAFVDVLPAREITHTPTHNPSYKHALLLEFGEGLESALSGGYEMSVDWRARGHRFYFEPAAKVEHVNVSRILSWLRQRYVSGVVHGAERSRRWSWLRRAAYACAAPLIPAVFIYRAFPALRLLERERRLPRYTRPALLLGAILVAAGEMVGYAAGARPADKRLLDEYELHKLRYAGLPESLRMSSEDLTLRAV